ncbi:MAG: biotin transporter BioY [Clostridia bacterium]|nr:biotin transporter BioY [Clostridia bacterium]
MRNARRDGRTERTVLCALFVALTAACAQIIIPIGAVPVSLSLLPVLLCATMLPVQDALLAMGAYLLLGLAGVPVFSGFAGGPAKLAGPTGGYLIGYLPCVLCAGMLIRRFGRNTAVQTAAMVLGVLVCYAFGTAWFAAQSGWALGRCLTVCVFPFLPFDAAKVALSSVLSRRLYPLLA